MKIGLIEPHYLPSLEYFTALLPVDKIVLECHEHYVKQSYRNRCYINTTQGPVMLVVPLTEKHGKVPLREVRVDYSTRWQNNHTRSIRSAYAKAPFFEHFSDDLFKIIYGNHTHLVELNRAILSFCLQSLRLKMEISETDTYTKESGEYVFDLRSQISPKTPCSDRSFYRPVPYYQVFGNAFAGNLSLIDLLFCEGPHGRRILRESSVKI